MYIRKLPSGLWQCTVRKPNGKKSTATDKLKSVVKAWGIKEEARYKSGDRRDPRSGEIKISEWRERKRRASALESPTNAKVDSIWRTHCAEQWGDWPLQSITRMECQEWANKLTGTRLARQHGRDVLDGEEAPYLKPSTVHEIVAVMSSLYTTALKEDPPLVSTNPFAGLKLPRLEPSVIEFYEPQEAEVLYNTLEGMFGLSARTLAELGMDVGLRPGEIYGLHSNRVDWLRGQIQVHCVMTRYGLREHGKSKKSRRTVPVPPATLEAMKSLMEDRPRWGQCTCPRVLANGERVAGKGPCAGLVFSAPKGGPIDDGDFRARVWMPAVDAARTCETAPASSQSRGLWTVGKCGPELCDDPAHKIRRFPPRIMRHTAASWLVQAGVPLYHVQHLLGHERSTTTERYAHLAPDAHGEILGVWERRTALGGFIGSGAPVAHKKKEARSS